MDSSCRFAEMSKEKCHPNSPIWDGENRTTKLAPCCSQNINDNDVIMGVMATENTSLTIVYSTVYWGAYQRKHQTSASLAFVQGIHRWPVNSPHKWPVTRKMSSFDDVIMMKYRTTNGPHVSGNTIYYTRRHNNRWSQCVLARKLIFC